MKRIFTWALCLLAVAAANAADFFSTEKSEELFTFGARIGVNTMNRTMDNDAFRGGYHNESWRTGFDLGFVANLNFRDYLSIQPGLFFDIYNSGYTMITEPLNVQGASDARFAQAGRLRSCNLTVPVMAVVGFNVTDDLRWTVEAGPYVSFVLGSKLTGKYLASDSSMEPAALFTQKPATFDFGFKFGTGLQVMDHYYIGAHYLAGCLDAWKNKKVGELQRNFGGVTKAWVFTLGYNF